MSGLRISVRVRLTALYAALFLAAGARVEVVEAQVGAAPAEKAVSAAGDLRDAPFGPVSTARVRRPTPWSWPAAPAARR